MALETDRDERLSEANTEMGRDFSGGAYISRAFGQIYERVGVNASSKWEELFLKKKLPPKPSSKKLYMF